MGTTISNLFEEKSLLMLGLMNSGKTTILNKVSKGEPKVEIPSVGPSHKIGYYKDTQIKSWDLGIGEMFRQMNRKYYENC